MEREKLNKNIGFSIRKYRLSKDLSQESLALSAGIHPAYLGRLERGEKCPTIDTLYKICDALNISICQLLNFENDIEFNDTEVKLRIETAVDKLPYNKQIRVAEIIENIADIINNK